MAPPQCVLVLRPSASSASVDDRLADDGLPVRSATTDGDWRLDGVDCVVCLCPPEGVASGLDAVAAVHEAKPLAPVLAYSPATDGDLAIEATRRGATEYVSGEYLDEHGETLAARVRAVCARDDTAESIHRATVPQLESVANHPASFAAVLAPDGAVRLVNAPALEFVAVDPADVEGDPFWETPWWSHSESLRERLCEGVERAAEGERATLEADHYSPDGERLVVELSLSPVRDDEGDVVAISAEGHDVTRRQALTDELRENQTALERLYRISSDSGRPFEEKLEGLLEIGCDRLGLEIGYVASVDTDAETHEIVAAHTDLDGLEAGMTTPLSETFCRETVRSDDLVTVRDAESSGWADDPAYRTSGIACYLGAKLTVGDDVYGTLCFADRKRRDVEFGASERTLVELIAEWVSHELERRRSQAELEDARDELEETFERIADAFFAVDDEWRITLVNGRFEELLGRRREDVVGENLWEEFPEAINDLFYEEYHEAMATQEPTSFEEYFEPVDAWFEVNAYPSEDGLSVFFRDVTDSREYERILSDLLRTSRRFMQADTPEAIADVVVEAAEEVLGNPLTLVRLYDENAEALLPVSMSAEAEELMGERPTYAPGTGPVGRAFESGEPAVYPDVAAIDDDKERSPIRSAMYVPLGRHGTLTVGSLELDGFTTSDRQYVELLAANADAALNRADRQEELRVYEAVLETVRDMVYVLDEDGRFTFVTDRLAEWLGYAPDELVGEHVSTVLDEAVVDASAPAADSDADAAADAADAADADGASHTYETEAVTADGRRVPAEIEVSAFPADSEFDGSVGSVRNLTDLVSARRDAVAQRERFSSLFENLSDPVVELEFEGDAVVESVNPAFERVFDVDAAALSGRRVDGLDDVPVPSIPVDGEPNWTVELTSNTPTGRRQFLFRGVRYRRDDAVKGFGIYTDVTALKQRERHLQVLNRILRHNLRNDLNVVYGFADQLVLELDDDTWTDYARRIRDTADGLAQFSETAKDIERVIGREIATKPVDPVAVVEDLIETYREDDAAIDVAATELADVSVYADQRLRLALDQLVENAVEHTSEAPTVRLAVVDDPDPTWVTIRVDDDGPGIPTEEWEIVVDERDITPLEHGTGLGLWLVKWVVDAYGGELAYEQSDLGGSAVVIRLRRAAAA